MAGRGKFNGLSIAKEKRVIPFRLPGLYGIRSKCPVGVQQGRSFRQILLRKQTLDWRRHEIGIAQVALAIGEGEPLGVADQPPTLRVLRPETTQVEVLQNTQHLPYGDAARGGRSHAANMERSVGDADGVPFPDAIVCQIREREDARVARRLPYRLDDCFGNGALVEGFCAACGDRPQRLSIGLVLQDTTDLQRCAGLVKEVARGALIGLQLVAFCCDERGQAGGDLEALGSQFDGRVEQPGPLGCAKPRMNLVHQFDCARRAYGPSPDHGIHEFQRLSLIVQEELRCRLHRGRLSPVERGDLAG